MLKNMLLTATIVCSGLLIGATAQGDELGIAKAVLTSADGKPAGTATLVETANGVLLTGELINMDVGEHGFHIHETGKCRPDFAAAGGHLALDGKEHGFANKNGFHAGDFPNVFVPEDGSTKFQFFNTRISLSEGEDTIFDSDGAALIVHANADSYLKDAAAGARVACGVIEKAE